MQKIFEEYGGVIIVAIAIVALIAVVTLLVGGEGGGWIGDAFEGLITNFMNKTNTALNNANFTPAS